MTSSDQQKSDVVYTHEVRYTLRSPVDNSIIDEGAMACISQADADNTASILKSLWAGIEVDIAALGD